MFTKNTWFALAVLTAVTGAPSAWADCRKKINLIASSAGIAIDASGTAEVRQQGFQQRFKVSMDARVPNGATFVVSANGQAVGVITIQLGDGELDLNNNNGKTLPLPLSNVCAAGVVSVAGAGGVTALSGSF